MPINQLSASALESIVRKVLSLDIEAHNKLKPFNDKTILLKITDLKLQYYFTFDNGQVYIQVSLPEQKIDNDDNNEAQVSVIISGKLSSFIAAAAADHSSDALFEGELHFSGEINTAKKFQQLAASLNIDWEEPLAKLIGDPLAHTLSTGLQHFSSWFLQSLDSAKQDVSEYVQEEARLTPSDSEQQQFFEQVDQLKSKLDRLLARVERINSESSDKDDK